MRKVTLILYRDYLEDIIVSLHESGIMQISDISKQESSSDLKEFISPGEIHPDGVLLAEYENRLSTIITILNNTKEKTKGMKKLLHPQLPKVEEVSPFSTDALFSYAEGFLNAIEKEILPSQNKLESLTESIQKTTMDINNIQKFTGIDFHLSDLATSDFLICKSGITQDLKGLQQNLKNLPETAVYSNQLTKGKNATWAVILIAHKEHMKHIERISTEFIEEIILPNLPVTPNTAISTLTKEIKTMKKDKKTINKTLQHLAQQHLQNLYVVREQIQLEKIRKDIQRHFGQTHSTYVITGWVPVEDIDGFKTLIKHTTQENVIIDIQTPSPNPDNPPTSLKTRSSTGSFKTLLELFAVPRYNEINPSVIMGFFFVLFFGVMLGDAGYGLVILLLALFAHIKFSQYSDMIKSWSILGIFLGIVTSVVGLLTNGFFGDLIPRFIYGNSNQPLYQLTLFGINFPVEPLKDPLSILIVALILGLLHLNVGIILGLYQAFKRKEYRAFLTEKFCMIPLQIGGGALIGYFIMDWQFSQAVFYAAIVLVIIGIIQLFLASGPVGFFDITGYVGDWLSYARLLALGLATAGMALAFNVVAGLIPEMIPVVGIILLPIILFVAHTANLILQSLGAGVHSLRLQYVEFFNRFYEGGGHEFSPFKIRRTYTTLKEDKTS